MLLPLPDDGNAVFEKTYDNGYVQNNYHVQEILCLLWNPEVHHHVHYSPPLVAILSQTNAVHILTHFLQDIIHTINA
jgi:hypothetical protein